MPTYYNTTDEYGGVGAKNLPVIGYDYSNGQKILFGTTSTQSAALTSEIISVCCTTDCYINIGDNPVAVSTGGSKYLFAGAEYLFRVSFGDKLAVLRSVSDGYIFIMPAG